MYAARRRNTGKILINYLALVNKALKTELVKRLLAGSTAETKHLERRKRKNCHTK
jgi:hypothetical protein